ncbi:hypothetical protein OFC87_36800, partial [Escherichia coli]|nr:hypothetical protein [Escherichia coli]
STACANAAIEIVPFTFAGQSFPRRRGKVQHWNDLIKRTTPPPRDKSDLDRVHQSLAMLLVLEMAYAAADIFPVEIVKAPQVSGSD